MQIPLVTGLRPLKGPASGFWIFDISAAAIRTHELLRLQPHSRSCFRPLTDPNTNPPHTHTSLLAFRPPGDFSTCSGSPDLFSHNPSDHCTHTHTQTPLAPNHFICSLISSVITRWPKPSLSLLAPQMHDPKWPMIPAAAATPRPPYTHVEHRSRAPHPQKESRGELDEKTGQTEIIRCRTWPDKCTGRMTTVFYPLFLLVFHTHSFSKDLEFSHSPFWYLP